MRDLAQIQDEAMKRKSESLGIDFERDDELLSTNESTFRYTMIHEIHGRPAIIKKQEA